MGSCRTATNPVGPARAVAVTSEYNNILDFLGNEEEVDAYLRKRAWALVRRTSIPTSDQEDAVQEMIIAGWSCLGEYDFGLDYMVFLRMKARLVDFSRKAYRTRESPAVIHESNGATDSPEDLVIDAEWAKNVVDNLLSSGMLTSAEKRVAKALMVTEGDRRAAREMLGLTASAFNNTLYRIRDRIEWSEISGE